MKKLSLLPLIAIASGKKNPLQAIKILFFAILFGFAGHTGFAQVSVAPGSGGTGICPTKAIGGGATAYTALGTITVAEGSANDLSFGANVITINPPAGWQFNTAATPTFAFAPGQDITSVIGSFSSGNLVVTVTAGGTVKFDQFTITGLQVEATSPGSSPGYVYSSVAFVPGITTGSSGTDFADLSLAVPLTPSVSIAVSPTGSVCAGTNLTFTPTPTNGGLTPSYQWFVNGSSVGSGGTYSTSTLSNGNLVDAVMTVGGVPSCTYPLTATSSSITAAINALPTTVSVSGGGSFCGSTTITASNGGSGTIYFQGTTSGGTSTATPSTSEVIASSGTYYFRAQSGAGCWGTEGSVTVTINPVPGAVTVSGGTTTCGTAQTITASGGLGGTIYFENTVSNGTSTATPSTSQSVSSSGTYYFRAEQGTCWGVQGSTVVTVNPLPTAFTVTGGGGYCTGATGVTVGLNSSTSGVNYQLFVGGVSTGSPVAGTGAAISFGLQTTAGVYTVVATNATTLCTNNMSGSVTVTINPLPSVFAMTGGGDYCAGATGVAVGLSGSTLGVNYQLYIGGVPTGAPVPGTGGAITFGLQTVGSTYTSVATDVNGCTSNMTGSSVVTIDPLPTAYSLTGGGNYCSGGTGVAVGLSNSASGINYELYLGGVTTGIIVGGTGGAISFGLQTAAGSYTVVATNTTTLCTKNMTGSATVGIYTLPTTFSMTGGGNYCSGGSGIAVGLGGSTSTVSYQLYLGGVSTGAPVGGTGSAISFGLQTGTGSYTAVATDVHGCTSNMTGTATVGTNPLPTAYSVTGGGSYCSGGTGVAIGLGGSDLATATYQLYLGGTPVGSAVTGTGGAITFGNQTAAGIYTVSATTTATGCTNGMTGSQTITINPLPTIYTVTGGGSYCAGGTGVAVGLTNSAVGINYQLYIGGVSTGAPVAGAGGPISFGLQTGAGVYTVIATNATTTCTNNMSGSATIVINPLPVAYAVTGGGGYCVGSPGVHVGVATSDLGISYQLYRGGIAVGSALSGTGGALDFGIETIAGVYTVIGTNTSSSCTNNMTGSVTVVVNPLPNAFAVTGGGPYCSGGTGVAVGLASSVIGINYQLFLSGIAVGSAVAGTGSAITFGLQTGAGVYTVVATNALTLCTNNMTGSATITINPLPTAYSVTGGGGYCAGGTGVHVGLASSDAGISYQLYRGGVATGIILAGTGLPLDFGLQTIAAAYTVVATNTTTGCTDNMGGSATVSISPLPTVFTVGSGGSYCAGGVGIDITLSGSQVGVNYQLYVGLVPTGGPVAGTGIGTLDMGFQTAAGVYTIVATNTVTSCTSNMTGSATIVVNPLPIVYTVTGGGGYCAGGTGVHVGLSGSDVGINYQLFLGGVGGIIKAGTGGALDFGLQTTAGSYTVVATNPATTCTSNMTGTVNVSINPLPNSYTFTSFGISSYCAGGTGINVFLIGSDIGVNYQLFIGGVATGAPVAGTGGIINFGTETLAGTYTVVGTNPVTGCTNNMTGSVTITVNPLPIAYSVTGGGPYCSGGSGVAVGLSNSTSGVNYELFLGGVTTGIIVPGTGAAITFGLQTGAGSYTVVGTNTTTTCTNNMTGSATVVINPLPNVYAVTGGGAYCLGGTGVDIVLGSSDLGINYQLFNGGLAVGSPLAGTGALLDFGLQTGAGTYTVVATNAVTGCINNMSGSATVSINPLPTAFTVTGGGSYCAGGTGVAVGLFNSTTGVNYQLMNGFTAVGAPVAGNTGFAISFGLQTAAGFYTVVATDAVTGCTNTMTGGVAVTIIPLPTAYNVLGGGGYCAGGTGVDVSLASSDVGVNYQLWRGGVSVGAAMPGTGGALDFGLQTIAGGYTVVATNPTTTCTNNMTGTANVVINPLPTAFTVSGGGDYCSGGAGLHVFLSSSFFGINYQLFDGILPVGGIVAGTGSAIDFGSQTAAGIYTVVASNPITLCTNNMTGSATIVIDPLPAIDTVTGGGPYCAGGTGVDVGLNTSDIGINYQLFNGGVAASGIIPGTGLPLDFGLQTVAGTYTVVAANAITGCQSNMWGSAVVIVNPLPLVYTLSGGGSYCSGGTGIDLQLSGSNLGISYQLWVGGVPVGSPVAGTGGGILDLGFQTTGGVYTVVATDTLTGCTNNMTGTATIVVNPLPFAYSVLGGGSYCDFGTGVDVSLSGSDIGITYQLFVGGVPTGPSMPGTGLPIDFNLQTTAGIYTVVGSDNVTFCTNNMAGSQTVVINPLPTVFSITGGGAYCTGGSGVSIIVNNSEVGVNYQGWVGGVATGPSVPGTGSPLIIVETVGGTYSIVATNATTGCVNNMTGTATVVVNPLPAAIVGATSECQGSTTMLSDASTSGVWTSDNTAVATVDATTGLVTGVSGGTYNVSYTLIATGCLVSSLDTVNALPVVPALVGSASVCTGFVASFTDATPGGAWMSDNTTVATVDASGNVTGVAAGVANISYTVTSAFGCVTTVSAPVTVLTSPDVTAVTGMFANVCTGLTLALSDTTTGGVWTSGNTASATVSSVGVVTGIAPGVAVISYSVTNGAGCTVSALYPMTIGNPMPASVALPASSATLCHGNPVNLTVVSASGGLTYQWSLSDTAIVGATDSIYVAGGAGVYTVILGNGTCNELLSSINVLNPPLPVVNYDSLGNLLYAGAFTTYQWFLNGDTLVGDTSSTINNPAPGSYMVVVSDGNGCSDTSFTFIVQGTVVTKVNPVINGSDIKIYPNPATSVLYIDAPVSVYVTVVTTDGKILMGQKEAKSLNVGQLADGVYMIMIYDEHNMLLKADRFVKMQ